MLHRSTQTHLSMSELPYSLGNIRAAWVSNSVFASLPLFSPIQHTVSAEYVSLYGVHSAEVSLRSASRKSDVNAIALYWCIISKEQVLHYSFTAPELLCMEKHCFDGRHVVQIITFWL